MSQQSVVNQFSGGLEMDMATAKTSDNVLIDALNATYITMNGNEKALQNDMGNGRVERAFLPPGYVPVGMKEYGGIIYIASYNPLTNKGQVGSFPSPERNIDSSEASQNIVEISWEDFAGGEWDSDYNPICKTFIVKSDVFQGRTFHSGDKYTIYMDGVEPTSLKLLSNYNNVLQQVVEQEGGEKAIKYIVPTIKNDRFGVDESSGTLNVKPISPKNNIISLKLAVLDSNNRLRDITNQCKRFTTNGNKSTIIQFDLNTTPLLKFNSGYFIPTNVEQTNIFDKESSEFIKERNKKPVNTFNSKISGEIYIVATINTLQNFTVSAFGYQKDGNDFDPIIKTDLLSYGITEFEQNADYLVILQSVYTYNCPDGVTSYTDLGLQKNYGDPLSKDDIEIIPQDSPLGNYWTQEGLNTENYIQGYRLTDKSALLGYTTSEEGVVIQSIDIDKSYVSFNSQVGNEDNRSYDPNTGLYTVVNYQAFWFTIENKDEYSSIIFNYEAEPSMTFSKLPALTYSGSIDLKKLGTGVITLNEWRYFNDLTEDALTGTLTVGFESYREYSNIRLQFLNIKDPNIKEEDIQQVNLESYAHTPTFNGSVTVSYNILKKDSKSEASEESGLQLKEGEVYLVKITGVPKNSSDESEDNFYISSRLLLVTELFNDCYFLKDIKDYQNDMQENEEEKNPDIIFKEIKIGGTTYKRNAIKEKYQKYYNVQYDVDIERTSDSNQQDLLYIPNLSNSPIISELTTIEGGTPCNTFYKTISSSEDVIKNKLKLSESDLYPFQDIQYIPESFIEIQGKLVKQSSLPTVSGSKYSILENTEFSTKDDLEREFQKNTYYDSTEDLKHLLYTNLDIQQSNITINTKACFISTVKGKYTDEPKTITPAKLYKPYTRLNTFFSEYSDLPHIRQYDGDGWYERAEMQFVLSPHDKSSVDKINELIQKTNEYIRTYTDYKNRYNWFKSRYPFVLEYARKYQEAIEGLQVLNNVLSNLQKQLSDFQSANQTLFTIHAESIKGGSNDSGWVQDTSGKFIAPDAHYCQVVCAETDTNPYYQLLCDCEKYGGTKNSRTYAWPKFYETFITAYQNVFKNIEGNYSTISFFPFKVDKMPTREKNDLDYVPERYWPQNRNNIKSTLNTTQILIPVRNSGNLDYPLIYLADKDGECNFFKSPTPAERRQGMKGKNAEFINTNLKNYLNRFSVLTTKNTSLNCVIAQIDTSSGELVYNYPRQFNYSITLNEDFREFIRNQNYYKYLENLITGVNTILKDDSIGDTEKTRLYSSLWFTYNTNYANKELNLDSIYTIQDPAQMLKSIIENPQAIVQAYINPDKPEEGTQFFVMDYMGNPIDSENSIYGLVINSNRDIMGVINSNYTNLNIGDRIEWDLQHLQWNEEGYTLEYIQKDLLENTVNKNFHTLGMHIDMSSDGDMVMNTVGIYPGHEQSGTRGVVNIQQCLPALNTYIG